VFSLLQRAFRCLVCHSFWRSKDRLAAGGEIKQLVETSETPDQAIELLFIRALSRKPTAEELQSLRELIGDATKDYASYEDIFWGLLNSTEFGFNH
jgi:hypothetical protein